MRGSYTNDPCRSERGGEPDEDEDFDLSRDGTMRPILEIAEALYGSFTGMSDPMQDDEEAYSLAVLRARLSHWTPSWHALSPDDPCVRYDEGARMRIQAVVDMYDEHKAALARESPMGREIRRRLDAIDAVAPRR